MTPSDHDAEHLTSVGKALRLFDLIGIEQIRTLPSLTTATGWPKSTILRLLGELVDAGLVRRTAHGEYGITLRTWRIGCQSLGSGETHQSVVARLRTLVNETGETAHYSTYDGGWAVYLEKVDGLHPVRAYTQVGGRSPAYASATGKALLAWQPRAEIEAVAQAAERFTDSTITDPGELVRTTDAIRAQGYAVNHGEWRARVWGVGAPLFDSNGQVVSAIGVSGPQDRIEPAIERYATIVRHEATEVTVELGGRARN